MSNVAITLVKQVQINGVPFPAEPAINFIGATGADNPTNGSTDVTLTGGGSTSTTGIGLWYNAVSGVLNSSAVTLVGDVSPGSLSGSNLPLTVVGLQGITVPTPTGSNTVLTYSSGAYTWGTTASGVTWSNDLAGSTNTNQFVSGLSGYSGSGGAIAIGDGLHAVTLTQSGTVALTLISGGTLELESAGNLVLKGAGQPNFVLNAGASSTTFSGGTTTPASFLLENSLFALYAGGSSPIATATTIGWAWTSSSVTLAASGTTTLTTAQKATPLLIMGTVTLTANVTLALAGVGGAFYLDFSAVTLAGHTITVTNGSGSATVSSSTLVIASCLTTNLISLTPSTVPTTVTLIGDVTQGVLSGSNLPLTVVALQGHAVSSTAPTSAQMLVYAGSTWTPVSFSGDVTVSSTGVTTLGKIDGITLPTPTGTNSFLSYTGSALSWTTSVTATNLNLTSQAQGDVTYYNGSAWVVLAPGTSGQFLQTKGASANPVWTTATTIPIVVNIAALGALSAAAFVADQPAIVQSNNALWSYLPTSALTVDGITVIAATPSGQWVRVITLATEKYVGQTTWWVDPQNVETTSSDENTGLTASAALRSKAEIARRWGTWSPTLNGIAVAINYLSADTTGNDPALFAPTLIDGATLIQQSGLGGVVGALPAHSFSGSLLSVTANSPSSNVILQTTVTTTTGTLVAGMILVNATRGNSIAWVAAISEGIATLSQPMTPYSGSGAFGSTAVDTWANGDTITGYVLPNINMTALGGSCTDFGNTLALVGHTVWRLNVWDPYSGDEGSDPLTIDLLATPQILESSVGRACSVIHSADSEGNFGNSAFTGGFFEFHGAGGLSAVTPCFFYAGYLQASLYASGVQMSNNTILLNNSEIANAEIAGLALGSGVTLSTSGYVTLPASAFIYGTGALNVLGTLNYTSSAVSSLPVGGTGGGGLTLNSRGTGYSNATSAGVVTTHGSITLTPAHLDATAGSTGFGGYAFGGGAFVSNGGAQP